MIKKHIFSLLSFVRDAKTTGGMVAVYWSAKKGRVIGNTEDAKTLNETIYRQKRPLELAEMCQRLKDPVYIYAR